MKILAGLTRNYTGEVDFHSDGKEKRITYVIESVDAEEAQKILRENGYHVVSQNDREVRINIDADERIKIKSK